MDPKIEAAVEKVSASNLQADVAALTAFPTRHSSSPATLAVSQHLHDRFVALGYTADCEVGFQPFPLAGTVVPQRNVLCGALSFARPCVIVCAHYDSVSGNPLVSAPGAVDNASGVAALLELARLLREHTLTRDVLFVAFGGEENGYAGARECAAVAVSSRWPVEIVVNLDMVGVQKTAPGTVIVEFDDGNHTPANDEASRGYAELMAQAAADYTVLRAKHSNIWNSDYIPFEREGFVCIGAYQGPGYAERHTEDDVLLNVNLGYVRQVTKMVLATILTIAT